MHADGDEFGRRCPFAVSPRVAELCSHVHFDLAANDDYLNGRMTDEDVTDDRLAEALATMPRVG